MSQLPNLDGHPHCRDLEPPKHSLGGAISLEAAWYCKTAAKQWTRYSGADSATLEAAFRARNNGTNKLRVPVVGGAYVVNLLQLQQYKADDAMRQRPVKRLYVAAAAASGAGNSNNSSGGGGDGSAATTAAGGADAKAKKGSKSREASVVNVDEDASHANAKEAAADHKAPPHAAKKARTESPAAAVAPNPYASFITSTPAPTASVGGGTVNPPNASSPSMFGAARAKNEKAGEEDATSPLIVMERFATSIFHVVTPAPVSGHDALTLRIHTADAPSSSANANGAAAATAAASGVYVPGGAAAAAASAKHAAANSAAAQQRPHFETTADAAHRPQLALFARLLRRCPPINRAPLAVAADKCRPHTRAWLRSIGRMSTRKGVFLELSAPFASLNKAAPVALTPRYSTTVGQLQALAGRSRLTVVEGALAAEAAANYHPQQQQQHHGRPKSSAASSGAPPAGGDLASVLVPCRTAAASSDEALTDAEHLAAQLLCLSGPVLVVVDGDMAPVADPPEVIAVSLPGINFAYSDADRRAFCKAVAAPQQHQGGGGSGGIAIHEGLALERMRLVWAHALAAMDAEHQVEVACLCAIGCGAFKGVFGAAVPVLWGRALAQALTHRRRDPADIRRHVAVSYSVAPCGGGGGKGRGGGGGSAAVGTPTSITSRGTFAHLEAVVVSLPTFGSDVNFAPFTFGLRDELRAIAAAAAKEAGKGKGKSAALVSHPPILLCEDLSMMAAALYFASEAESVPADQQQHGTGNNKKTMRRRRVGLLNPSDVQALRHGWVGMYWDGGHVALEELLAVTTTLLVQHVGLDRGLFTDANRRSVMRLCSE